MDFLQNHIEALIFCSKEPVRVLEIISCLEEMFGTTLPQEDIESALLLIIKKYEPDEFPFQVYYSGDDNFELFKFFIRVPYFFFSHGKSKIKAQK